jgi:hypothetical protein
MPPASQPPKEEIIKNKDKINTFLSIGAYVYFIEDPIGTWTCYGNSINNTETQAFMSSDDYKEIILGILPCINITSIFNII